MAISIRNTVGNVVASGSARTVQSNHSRNAGKARSIPTTAVANTIDGTLEPRAMKDIASGGRSCTDTIVVSGEMARYPGTIACAAGSTRDTARSNVSGS